MWAGRTEAQKKKLIAEVTNAFCKAIDCKPENVTIIIYDVEKMNWGKEGKPCTEIK